MRRGRWGLALLATLAGGAEGLRAAAVQPHRDAEWEGLRLRLERAVWLHEPMDHGDRAALPALPGVPRPGQRRLVVELSVFNPRTRPLDFLPDEVRLIEGSPDESGTPSSGPRAPLTLGPAQWLPVTLSFDVPAASAPLRLEWTRGPVSQVLLSTRPPRGPGQSPTGWPSRVQALPPGSAAAGSLLFHGRLACPVCHGDPETGEPARLGPPLEGFARVAATRVAGLSGAQYAYESLLEPNAFLAPGCAGGQPCARPSTMPSYGEVLSPQEMADLLRYLVSPRGAE